MILWAPLGARVRRARSPGGRLSLDSRDSSKGGAVETGCSDLYDVIIFDYVILPPSTAPPSHCTPL